MSGGDHDGADGSGTAASGGGDAGGGDWVKEPTENDVLCGRGGSINSHPGNERFRTLVEKRKRVYLTARFKREKRLIANSIVSEIRSLKPPGRFLSRDPKSGQWTDIGDEKARDKTSQALRENAPSLRAEIETELKEHRRGGAGGSRWDEDDDDGDGDDDESGRVRRADSAGSHASSSSMMRGAAGHHPRHHHPPPPPPSYYGSWGYPYYGYPPPPPPHGAHPHYPPPPPPHSYDPSYPYPPPPYGYPPVPPPGASAPPKSALEQTADTIKSYFSFGGAGTGPAPGARDHKSSGTTPGGHDDRSRSGSASRASQPLHYVHNDKKRRMVKFRDDASAGGGGSYGRRGGGSAGSLNRHHHAFPGPSGGSAAGTNSLMDDDFLGDHDVGMMGASGSGSGGGDDEDDMEPEHIESLADDPASSSLMAQVANHILGSIGSWDAASAICGHEDQAYDTSAATAAVIGTTPLQRHSRSGRRPSADRSSRYDHHHADHRHHHDSQEDNVEALADEDMGAVEWEGQEVLLMETSKRESSTQRMPPPPRPRPFPSAVSERHGEQASLGGFSSLGSCHSWLPEQISGAASFFSYNSSSRNPRQPSSHASNGGGISPAGSMDLAMEYSSSIGGGGHHGNEHYSVGSLGGGSIGNHSLSRVFENEALDQPLLSPVSQATTGFMSHRSLQQVPSWERSVRSRSPLSLGSMADDESLISKTSSKLSDSGNNHGAGTPMNNHPDAMAWERRE
jgi:hypothetical protein